MARTCQVQCRSDHLVASLPDCTASPNSCLFNTKDSFRALIVKRFGDIRQWGVHLILNLRPISTPAPLENLCVDGVFSIAHFLQWPLWVSAPKGKYSEWPIKACTAEHDHPLRTRVISGSYFYHWCGVKGRPLLCVLCASCLTQTQVTKDFTNTSCLPMSPVQWSNCWGGGRSAWCNFKEVLEHTSSTSKGLPKPILPDTVQAASTWIVLVFIAASVQQIETSSFYDWRVALWGLD